MSPIKQHDPLFAVLWLLVILLIAGCGSSNDSSSFSPDSGSHPAGWLPAGHKTAAIADLGSCAPCHGTDFTGGISGVSCTSCHLGGVASMHPLWGTPAYAMHGSYVKSNNNDTSGCANAVCHGTKLDGVGGAGPSCTSCHLGGIFSVHPAQWNGNGLLHQSEAWPSNITVDSCRNIVCHGAALEGVPLSGPSCIACHKTVPELP